MAVQQLGKQTNTPKRKCNFGDITNKKYSCFQKKTTFAEIFEFKNHSE
jgi:hypothetical protein